MQRQMHTMMLLLMLMLMLMAGFASACLILWCLIPTIVSYYNVCSSGTSCAKHSVHLYHTFAVSGCPNTVRPSCCVDQHRCEVHQISWLLIMDHHLWCFTDMPGLSTQWSISKPSQQRMAACASAACRLSLCALLRRLLC